MEDKRFAHLKTDPKFRRIPKGARKVKIDKRFQSMFKDKKFKVKYTVDKRGRPVNHNSTEDLKRYYELSSSDEESIESGKYVKAPPSEDLTKKEKTDKEISSDIKKKLRNLNVDYARGETALHSDSSSDDEESDDEVPEEDVIEHKWGELDNDAGRTEESTSRLAACNMDWDRIRAVDLMVLFSSFVPAGGAIKSVAIYPSEFGKARMKEEEIKGPIELVETRTEEEQDGEEGAKYHMEKLRQYQLNRLKYYYAVITCDNVTTADKIYSECDGMEYESSATKIDLRFIPEDMTFEDEFKEMCDKLPELNKYQPRFFTTTALQQAKVDLTWDETDPERIEISQKLNSGKIEDISESDLQNYVAVSESENEDPVLESSSEGEDGAVSSIDKYKKLLIDIEGREQEKKNKDVEMEVTWGIDLKNKTEKLVKEKIEGQDKTPFQKYLDKRKEKRKEKKNLKKAAEHDSDDAPSEVDMNDPYFAEEFNNSEFRKKNAKKNQRDTENEEDTNRDLELLLMDDDHKSHFSLKKIQKQEEASTKKKSRKIEQKADQINDFQVNVDDERFSAIFSSHLYNIDPTDPHYKKTKGMESLIAEKIKRRRDDDNAEEVKKVKKDGELSALVKSVKRKAEALTSKRNK